MKSNDSRDAVEIRKSPISGKGIFARSFIKKGTIVFLWHPKILSKQEADTLPDEERRHYLYPEGNKMLWMQPPERYLNHSCDPNTSVVGQSDVALRDIQPGEEITSDYIDLETEKFKCHCGSSICRNPAGRADSKLAS